MTSTKAPPQGSAPPAARAPAPWDAPLRSLALVFGAFRSRAYRTYWTGLSFSVLAQTMEFVTLSWLVYDLTHSALSLGATGLAQSLPRIVLVFVGGAVADRVDRLRLVIITQVSSGLLHFALATLVMVHAVQLGHILVAAFLLGSLRAFDGPSRQALLPQMVSREDLPNAVALGNLAWQGSGMIGPALAGGLIAVFGVGPTLYASAGCFFAAVLLFRFVAIRAVPRGRSGNFLADLLGGVDYIRRNAIFYQLMGMTFFSAVFGMSYQFLLPIFARDILQAGSQGFGLLQGGAAVGATCGTFAAALMAGSQWRGWRIVVGAVAYGALLLAFSFSQWFPASLALLFFAGFANNIYSTAIATVLQLQVPDEYRARVMGVYSITWSLQPLGGMVASGIAEYAGAPFSLALGGSLVASWAIMMTVLFPQIRRL